MVASTAYSKQHSEVHHGHNFVSIGCQTEAQHWPLPLPPLQVYDYSWSDLQSLSWPSGAPLLTVSQALGLTAHLVQLIIIDLKTTDDVGRVRFGGGASQLVQLSALTPTGDIWQTSEDVCWLRLGRGAVSAPL